MWRMTITWHPAFPGTSPVRVEWFASEEEAKQWWLENHPGFGRGASRVIEHRPGGPVTPATPADER